MRAADAQPVVVTVPTPRGPARAHLTAAGGERALVLGHGAGGGVGAADLQAARDAALSRGWSVVLVEQPYRVAERRAPPRAPALDEAWLAVVAHLRADALRGAALVTGGRSSGARVACRTSAAAGAIGVLCLAFPLTPPARTASARAPVDRLAELEAVPVPVLVVQGDHDRFGMPSSSPTRSVVAVRGDHALRSDLPAVSAAVGGWLDTLGAALA